MNKVLLIGVNSKYSHSSLALRYFREYAKCSIFECTINDNIFDIYSRLVKMDGDILCFSVYIWNVEFVLKLIPMIKTARPDVKIILGGPEAGYNYKTLLKKHNFIDGIICGEGEEAIKALVNDVPKSQIPNLVYGNNVNEFIKTDLSKIIFPYTSEDLEYLKNKIIYFESSRGCLYNCSYCLSSSEGKTRYFPMDYVKNALKFFIDNNVTLVKFVDRTFNENNDRACEIAQFIVDYNKSTQFHFEISPQLLTNEFLNIVEKSQGKIQFEMGIQTTNPDTMKAIKRVFDLNKTKEKVLSVPECVHTHLDLIAGLPHETLKTFINGFNYVYSMKPQMLQLGFLKLLHNTNLKKDSEQYGIKTTEFPPYEVISTNTMSPQDIIFLKQTEKAVDRIYNSGAFTETLNLLETPNSFEIFAKIGQEIEEREKDAPISRTGLYELMLNIFSKQNLCESETPSKATQQYSNTLYLTKLKKALVTDFLNHNHKAPLPLCFIDDCPDLKEKHKFLSKLPQFSGQKLKLIAAANSYFAVSDKVYNVTNIIQQMKPTDI